MLWCRAGTPALSIAKPSWEDGQTKSSSCKLIPSALSDFYSEKETHRTPQWHTQFFSQQLSKCSITQINVRVGRTECAVEKERSKFMQHKSGLKCPQPVLKELCLQSMQGWGVCLACPLPAPRAPRREKSHDRPRRAGGT